MNQQRFIKSNFLFSIYSAFSSWNKKEPSNLNESKDGSHMTNSNEFNSINQSIYKNNFLRESDSEKRSFKIDLNKMKSQFAAKSSRQTKNGINNNNMRVHEIYNDGKDDFVTFNVRPDTVTPDGTIRISKEEQQLIKDHSESDSEDLDKAQTKKFDQDHSSMFQEKFWNTEDNLNQRVETQTRQRPYINEFGEESLLTESSVEDNQRSSIRCYETSKQDPIREISNTYNQGNSYNKPLNPQQMLLNQSKDKMWNTSNSIDMNLVPKIKLSDSNCKNLVLSDLDSINMSQVHSSYNTAIPQKIEKYPYGSKLGNWSNFKKKDRSFIVKPSVMSTKKHSSYGTAKRHKKKISSCSFRNQHILNSNSFAIQRPASTVEHEQKER